MAKENIEIQLLHSNKIMDDTQYGIRVLIDSKEVFPLELDIDTMLHIRSMLHKADKLFEKTINNKQHEYYSNNNRTK